MKKRMNPTGTVRMYSQHDIRIFCFAENSRQQSKRRLLAPSASRSPPTAKRPYVDMLSAGNAFTGMCILHIGTVIWYYLRNGTGRYIDTVPIGTVGICTYSVGKSTGNPTLGMVRYQYRYPTYNINRAYKQACVKNFYLKN